MNFFSPTAKQAFIQLKQAFITILILWLFLFRILYPNGNKSLLSYI